MSGLPKDIWKNLLKLGQLHQPKVEKQIQDFDPWKNYQWSQVNQLYLNQVMEQLRAQTSQSLWTAQYTQMPQTLSGLGSLVKKLEKPEKYIRELDLPTRKSTTPLKGFRYWNYKDGKLLSFGDRATWEGPVLRADGVPENRRPEIHSGYDTEEQGYHGIYAYRSAAYLLLKEGPYRFALADWSLYIHGIVQCSGKVVVHEQGLRAEKVTIQLLWIPIQCLIEDKDIVKKLEDRYQCEVTTDAARYLEETENGDREGS